MFTQALILATAAALATRDQTTGQDVTADFAHDVDTMVHDVHANHDHGTITSNCPGHDGSVADYVGYASQLNKNYHDTDAFEEHLANYQHNLETVNALNAEDNNATFEVNQFSDMSAHEIAHFMGRPHNKEA